MDDINARVAVLEQIARSTVTTLAEVHSDMREIRTELKSQFRWVLGILVVVLVAQGVLWMRVGALSVEVAQITGQLTHITNLLERAR